MIKIGVSDCDHGALEQEKAVFAAAGYEMILHQCRSEDDLIEQMKEYSVVANQYAPFTARVFEQLPKLKCIVRYGVGVDHIDIEAAAGFGVKVCNVPDYGVQEVASHAAAMMFALCRKLIPMNTSVKGGEWKYELSIPVCRFSDMTIGVIGIGRIGKEFAHIVNNLGARIVAVDPLYNEGSSRRVPDGVEMLEMDELLRIADVVSIHAPLDDNKNLIGEAELKKMKESAVLINVSRGGIINEEALERALREKWIAGAACDVLVKEPPGTAHPLFAFDNFICTPHMAWYSQQASNDLKRKVAEEIVRFLKQEPLQNALN